MSLVISRMYRISYSPDNRSLAGKPVIFRGIVADRLSALGGPSALVELLSGEQHRVRAGSIIEL